MTIGIRQKLMLGFGGLLAIIVAIGLLTIAQIDELGQAIDVILRENYRSVVACQSMKDALAQIDRGLLLTLAGDTAEGKRLIADNEPRFRTALDAETHNITLPGERERAQRIASLFDKYIRTVPLVAQGDRPAEARRADYLSALQPLSLAINDMAKDVLVLNQTNMDDANNEARRLAAIAHERMLMAIVSAALLALLFGYLSHRWILHPISRLIDSTNEIRQGNLELVVKSGSRDEIGRLSEAFNEMTASLRQVRKADQLSLMRTRRATEGVFHALPDVIAVLDLDGRVDVSTEAADRYFGLKKGVLVSDLGYAWLAPLLRAALTDGRMADHESEGERFQQFVDNREHFFQPIVVPISGGPESHEPTGIALILKDVTQLHEQQELKRGVVSTVAHQLKTPLTSLRMSLYLLLEERIGALNAKQAELLIAARDDSERLVAILNDLLDLNRIESGRAGLSLGAVSPQALARDAAEPFLAEAKDKGITLTNAVSDELPEVQADREKIRQVFANLLSNALRFTSPGGSVTVRAALSSDGVAFFVEDTGVGVASEHLSHLFEPFYRVPGQAEESGVGLGLAIVREIVSAHGGAVGVESEPGKGSTFRFTLPLSEAAGKRS